MRQIFAICGAAALIMSSFSGCENRQGVPQPDVYTVTQDVITETVTTAQDPVRTEQKSETGVETAQNELYTKSSGAQTELPGKKTASTAPEQTKTTFLRTNADGDVILPEV